MKGKDKCVETERRSETLFLPLALLVSSLSPVRERTLYASGFSAVPSALECINGAFSPSSWTRPTCNPTRIVEGKREKFVDELEGKTCGIRSSPLPLWPLLSLLRERV